METNIQLPPQTKADGEIRIIEQQGAAERHPLPVKLEGDLFAPGTFATSTPLDLTNAVVQVDRTNLTIGLSVDPQSPNQYIISGRATYNPHLAQFKINKVEYFSRETLLNLVLKTRRFFADHASHAGVIKQLNSMRSESTTTQKFTETNSNNFSRHTEVSNTLKEPIRFPLTIKLFAESEVPVTIWVNVRVIDTTGSTVNLALESEDLWDIEADQLEALLEKALAPFTDTESAKVPKIPVLYKAAA